VNSILSRVTTSLGRDLEYMPDNAEYPNTTKTGEQGLWCYIIKYASNVPLQTKTIILNYYIHNISKPVIIHQAELFQDLYN